MFRIFNIRSGYLLDRSLVLAPRIERLSSRLAGCFDDDVSWDGLTNSNVFAWASYAESLIQLRLPFYLVWEHPSLHGDSRRIMFTHRDGAAYAKQNPDPCRRWAKLEDLDLADVVWHGLKGINDPTIFVTDPPPLPSSARNCAIAFALWQLDCAVAEEYPAERMCDTLSMVGLMLAHVAEDWGRGEGRIASTEAAAAARWERDPSRPMWLEVRAEWDRWQQDRSLHRLPRDFRRAMQFRFPELVDGTLKNRMSAWGRGES